MQRATFREFDTESAMFDEGQCRGARWILTDALEASPPDSVLIVHDEETGQAADCITQVGCDELSFRVRSLLVPSVQQAQLSADENTPLPDDIRGRIDESSHVIVLQRRAPEVNGFRMNVLQLCVNDPARRAASMAGITHEHLHRCYGNLNEISQRCGLIASLMVQSRRARLLTRSVSGDQLELLIDIADYKPILSTGRIAPGTWGNVPSGETFVVPNAYTASGSVAINGSILRYPIPEGEELVLQFDRGKVLPIPIPNERIERYAEPLLYDEDGAEAYPNCTVLAELGVGTNEQIKEFTGLPVFDEKILGTVHLGLGRSTQFGGNIPCRVHNDFVVKTPTLYLDDVLVTLDGEFVLKPSDVYPNWRQLSIDGLDWNRPFAVGSTPFHRRAVDGAPLTYVSWLSPRSKVHYLTRVGDRETCQIASAVVDLLKLHVKPLMLDELVQVIPASLSADMVAPTLRLLERFGVVKQM
jgi:hypothetical protein